MDFLAPLIAQAGPALLAALVPAVIALFKKIVPDIPSWAIPLMAPVLGFGGDFLLSLLSHVPATGWKGALAGLAGVGVREIVDQAKQALPAAKPPGA